MADRELLPLQLTREEWTVVVTWFGACDGEGFCDTEDYELHSRIMTETGTGPASSAKYKEVAVEASGLSDAEVRQWTRDRAPELVPLLLDAHRARANPEMRDLAAIGPVPDVWHTIDTSALEVGGVDDLNAWRLGVGILAYAQLCQALLDKMYDLGVL